MKWESAKKVIIKSQSLFSVYVWFEFLWIRRYKLYCLNYQWFSQKNQNPPTFSLLHWSEILIWSPTRTNLNSDQGVKSYQVFGTLQWLLFSFFGQFRQSNVYLSSMCSINPILWDLSIDHSRWTQIWLLHIKFSPEKTQVFPGHQSMIDQK